MADILCVDTVTMLGSEHRGQVLIGGSHGGIYAGYLAAKAGVRAVILHNAGIGKDEAGIGSLAYLDQLRLPAAVLDHMSARIAEDLDGRGVSLSIGVYRHTLSLVCTCLVEDLVPILDLLADIAEGHTSALLCHLGNIAYRTGRRLTFDGKTETFVGDDEANRYLTREYRKGYELPTV